MVRKKNFLTIVLLVSLLLLVSLACSLPFSGGSDSDQGSTDSAVTFGDENAANPDAGEPEMQEENTAGGEAVGDAGDTGGSSAAEAPFPLTDDADILTSGPEMYTYGTALTIEETIDFYRAKFDQLGFTERDLLTNILDDTFSMVFDGHSSGKAILVQGTDFGDHTNVSIQFLDM